MRTLAFLLLFSSACIAQSKYGATPADSVSCIKNGVNYDYELSVKNYTGARGYWLKAFAACPARSKNVYIKGEKIYTGLLKAAQPEQKQGLIDTLLLLHDWRMAHLGDTGYVLGKKGIALRRYKPKEVAFAHDVLKQSIEIEQERSSAAVLDQYFKTGYTLYRKGEVDTTQLVKEFERLNGLIDHALARSSTQYAKGYEKARSNMLERADALLTCAVLGPMKQKELEQHPLDTSRLRSAFNLLQRKGCTSGTIVSLAEALWKLEPTLDVARFLAKQELKAKHYTGATAYYKKAAELSEMDVEREKLHLKIADCYRMTKQYENAQDHANTALHYNPKSGQAYLILGYTYAEFARSSKLDKFKKGTIYWISCDMFARAKQLNASLAEEANTNLTVYRQYFPDVSALHFQTLEQGKEYEVGYWINKATTVRARP